jgi:hypothetical protein
MATSIHGCIDLAVNLVALTLFGAAIITLCAVLS